jgi:pimeloyl-ACP methyl ester carboxylesterase
LLVGALDSSFVRVGQELASANSRVQLDVVEGAGHNLLLEAPDRVARVITKDLG